VVDGARPAALQLVETVDSVLTQTHAGHPRRLVVNKVDGVAERNDLALRRPRAPTSRRARAKGSRAARGFVAAAARAAWARAASTGRARCSPRSGGALVLEHRRRRGDAAARARPADARRAVRLVVASPA
jgi:50S ribosomal subunit-associated GTPase HflX